MTNTRLKTLCVASALAAGMAMPVHAGLGTEMQNLFDGMKNSTPPGVYKSQNRMTLDGGGYFERVPITDTNIVNFEPPSFGGGCGGIDMNFGSLSFIDGDQFLQLLTNIGKNAKGYIFQLAMDNVFPEGAKWMDAMQEKIAEMNRYLGNSCQAAQFAVDGLAKTQGGQWVTGNLNKVRTSIDGINNDVYDAFTGGQNKKSIDSETAQACQSDPDYCIDQKGNLTYKSLKKQNVKSWFASDDDAMLPVLLSMSGSKIIMNVDPAGDESATSPIVNVRGHYLKLDHLVTGGEVPVYECLDETVGSQTFDKVDHCMKVGETTMDIKGLGKMINDAIAGDPSGTERGVIEKWADPTIGDVTAEQKKVMALLPQGIGGLLKAIARRGDPGAAIRAASGITTSLAYHAAFDLVEESLEATRTAIQDSVTNAANDLTSHINSSNRAYYDEFQVYLQKGVILKRHEMINHLRTLVDILPKPVSTTSR